MINGLGVLGWGVGGIEAEAVMLGQPLYMLMPEVVGFKLTGKLRGRRHRDRPGAHRHADAAQEGRGRQVRRVLRPGPRRDVARRPRHDRQHGARVRRHDAASSRSTTRRSTTCAAPAAARPRWSWSSATARSRACSAPTTRPSRCSATRWRSILSTVEPSLAGPKRPQDRVPLHADEGVVPQVAHSAGEGTRLRPGRGRPGTQRHGRRPTARQRTRTTARS